MRNKIVLVPFPFDDFSGIKVRPAVCLTDKIGEYHHIIIAFISSKVSKNKSETDILLDSGGNTGLKVDSVIRLHRITTIPHNLVKRELGRLPKTKEKELEQKLKTLFNLD